MKLLKVIFILLLTFEAQSYHSKPAFYKDGSATEFNIDHNIIGVEFQHDDYSVGYVDFNNSYYQRSQSIFLNYRIFDRFWLKSFYVSGYRDFKFGVLPSITFDWENITFDISFAPALTGDVNCLMLTKKVRF